MTNSILKPDDILTSKEAKANPRAAIARVKTLKAGAYSGQRKHDMRIGPQPAYVNAIASHLNMVIIEPPKPAALRKLCEKRRSQRTTQRKMRSDVAVAFIGIIGFGKEAQALFLKLSPEQQKEAYRETAKEIADRMGTTLEGLVSHGDETAPHAHFTCPAYNMDGEPLTSTVKRKMLRDIQTITAEVMGRHCEGIERGRSRVLRQKAGADYADTVNKSVRELHETLPDDIAKKQAELDALVSEVETAQAKYDEMQGRVQKLTEQEHRNVKEEKRLVTYEMRLKNREAALDEAEARLADQQTTLEIDKISARLDDEQLKREERIRAQAAQELADKQAQELAEKSDQIAEKEKRLNDDEKRLNDREATLKEAEANFAKNSQRLRENQKQLDEDINEYKSAARAEIIQLTQDQAELDKDRADLEARQTRFNAHVGLLAEVTNALHRMINRIGKKLGLPFAKDLTDALDQIDKTLPGLSDPEYPKPDSDDDGSEGPER